MWWRKRAQGAGEAGANGRRLDSWKEIAGYLGRTVRTAQAWESREGLPVHRHHHHRQATVFAYTDEIDAWRAARTAAPPSVDEPRASGRLAPVAAVGAVAIALGAGWLALRDRSGGPQPSPAPPLQVLVGSVENLTGDMALGRSAEALLRERLAETSGLETVPARRVDETLRRMRLPPGSALDPTLAEQIARRDSEIDAVIHGTLARTPKGLRWSGSIVAGSGEPGSIAFEERVGGPGELARAALRIVARLRQRSVPLRSVAAVGERLPRVTTGSSSALGFYAQAIRDASAFGTSGYPEASSAIESAIREDPEFAMAHLMQARLLSWLDGRAEESRAHARRALELAPAASEPERYYIEGAVAALEGDDVAARRAYETVLALDPDNADARSSLVDLSVSIDGLAGAAPLILDDAMRRPEDLGAQQVAGYTLCHLGRVEEAETFYARADALLTDEQIRKTPHLQAEFQLFPLHMHWQRNEVDELSAALDRWRERLPTQWTGAREILAYRLYWFYRAVGRDRDAEAIYREHGDPDMLPFLQAVRAFERNDRDGLLAAADVPIPETGRPAEALPRRAILLARAGEAERARRDLDLYLERFPDHTPLPVASAHVLAAEGREDEALALLEESLQKQLARGYFSVFAACALLADLHASRGDLDLAIEALELASSMRSRTYSTFAEPEWAGIQVRLAAAYRLAGRDASAAEIESELRTLFARADPDHWILCALETPGRRCTADVREPRTWSRPVAAQP